MKMTLPLLLSLLILSAASCKKSGTDANDRASLAGKFHGKYKVISSAASEPIDVDLDGTASVDMLHELPTLSDAYLELRIRNVEQFLLVQFWPEQYLSGNVNPDVYDPSITVNYARQGIVRTFSFDKDLQLLQVNEDVAPLPDPIHFPFPSAVSVHEENKIKIVLDKKLYTTAGWKTVEITTLYERFTSET